MPWSLNGSPPVLVQTKNYFDGCALGTPAWSPTPGAHMHVATISKSACTMVFVLGSSISLAAGPAPRTEKAPAAPAPALTDAEQVAGLQKMCADNGPAIQKRQAEKSLFERLGREPKIQVLAEKLLASHSKNAKIGRLFVKVKKEAFVKNVTDFLVVGTGGKAEYKGRDMATAHKDLKITNGDFLSAGGDVKGVMAEMGYGENEIQEVVCSLTSFVPVVVVQN
jgi:hemoglobin